MAATLAKRPTITVRITRKLANKIKEGYYPDRMDPAERFGPRLDPLVSRLVKKAEASLHKGKIQEDFLPSLAQPRRNAIVRLRRYQINRLRFVSSITGRSISEMVEEMLWGILVTK